MTLQPNLKTNKTEKMTTLGQRTNIKTALTDYTQSVLVEFAFPCS